MFFFHTVHRLRREFVTFMLQEHISAFDSTFSCARSMNCPESAPLVNTEHISITASDKLPEQKHHVPERSLILQL